VRLASSLAELTKKENITMYISFRYGLMILSLAIFINPVFAEEASE
jgi:hypothetical protein